jgi:hypothetical protein
MADESMKLYTLRYRGKRNAQVLFDGVSICCNNFSALVFIVNQAREKVRIDSSWKTSDSINDAMEIIEADTGRVVIEIEKRRTKYGD